jgi:effector-binding domain-containing protein
VKDEVSGRKAYHSLTAFPDSLGMATKVHWTESLSIIDWLKRRKETATKMETGLNNLKQLLEDPIKQYGFRIELKSVTDTLILIKEMTTTLRNRFSSLQNAYQDIREFAKQNDINITGREMANFHQIEDDSIQIMAGIPVSKKGTAKNGFAFLEMPNHGKMLVGYYDGPYSGLQKLYQAMEKYINEKNLKKISSEYEKYISSPVSQKDSSHVSLELHYPVL